LLDICVFPDPSFLFQQKIILYCHASEKNVVHEGGLSPFKSQCKKVKKA